MPSPEFTHLELLADVDDLVSRLTKWARAASDWGPLRHCHAIVHRLLSRVETLRFRLEAPLVVATFGGTGTGKSSLVNALVGAEISPVGRQRPTTTRPVVIAHPETDLSAFDLPLDELDVVRNASPLLRDVVVIDCPDPDTSETDTPGSNLYRLHRLLPHCDVLLITSTQQKYRSARVVDELARAASGCRLVFVQTHAAIDSDVRDDWRARLEPDYQVAEMFFVDSLEAAEAQRQGQRPPGEFGRLLDFLARELATSHRVRIRRANLLDLVQDALDHCRAHLQSHLPAVAELEAALEQQRTQLIAQMSEHLAGELRQSQDLWQRRLLSSVTQIWGLSPFSSILRLYNSLGNLIASASLFRARNSAQMALIGALQGARWLSARKEAQQAEHRLERLATCGLDDGRLREAQVIVAGYVHAARIDHEPGGADSLDALRDQAVRVEDDFLSGAGRRIDEIIDDLAARNSGILVRFNYELLFLIYVGYVLHRIGKNFFYDSFWLGEPILDMSFYVPAGVFFVLWSGLLVMLFTRRLQRGLKQQIRALAAELARARAAHGLFPELERTCRSIRADRDRLEELAQTASQLRSRLMQSSALAARIATGEFRDERVLVGGDG